MEQFQLCLALYEFSIMIKNTLHVGNIHQYYINTLHA